jgi:hypothetical protein
MAKSRKQATYLDTLADTLLPDDRRMALELMARVTLMRAWENSPSERADATKADLALTRTLSCAGCGTQLRTPQLFCEDYPCQQIAKAVRYVRRTEADRRIEKPDVQAGIGSKLWQLTGGGYPERARRLSTEQRQQILVRDKYRCQLCDNPANEVDHIAGDSSDPTNLRALCGDCNREESLKRKRPATDEEAACLREMFDDIAERIAAPSPTRLCDDPSRWDKCWRGIANARRRLVRQLQEAADEEDFEDVDDYLHDAMQRDD